MSSNNHLSSAMCRFLVGFILAVVSLETGGTALAAPAIEVTPSGLRATGVTPGGDAVWFGASIGTFNMSRLLKRHAQVVTDSDRDGAVSFDVAEMSRFVVLTVVDLTTGAFAVHRGAGVTGVEIDLRGNPWRAALEHFDIPAQFLEILLVRPGAGAWMLSGAEGGALDEDKSQNGAFRLKISAMDPLAGTGRAHGGVRRNDLLIIIDPQSLAYVVRTAKE